MTAVMAKRAVKGRSPRRRAAVLTAKQRKAAKRLQAMHTKMAVEIAANAPAEVILVSSDQSGKSAKLAEQVEVLKSQLKLLGIDAGDSRRLILRWARVCNNFHGEQPRYGCQLHHLPTNPATKPS